MNERLKAMTVQELQQRQQRRILAILKICKARNCLRRHPNVRYCMVTGETKAELQAIPLQSLPSKVTEINKPGCTYYGRGIVDYYDKKAHRKTE